jgi:signal transduction histidine kinase
VNDEHRAGDGLTSRASDRLLAGREEILSRWVARVVAEIPAASDTPQPILINTLPAVVRQIGEALSPKHPRRTATEGSTVAEEHGGERIRVTEFRLEDVMSEYRILREVITTYLEDEQPLTREERSTLHASIDQIMAKSCAGYTVVQGDFRQKLAAIVAHDLRNPLSAAKASAGLILRRPGADEVSRWAARTVDSLERVDRMVRDLLDVMRVDTGARLKLELAEGDLVELTKQTIDELVLQHGERFVVNAPAPVPGYFAPEAMRRAVENLVNNALKYGDSTRPITIMVRTNRGRNFIQIHNDGAHIPVDEQDLLFRAFHRRATTERGNKEGWGIGLAQARAVAEAHGGSIGLESLPELGTTFTIDVPADARPFQDKPAHPPP